MSSPVFTSFAELASFAGIETASRKKLKLPLPESSFLHVKELAGKPAAVVWVAINDRESSKRSGPAGSALVSLSDIMEDTGFDEDEVVSGIIRLAKAGLLSKVTRDGRVAA